MSTDLAALSTQSLMTRLEVYLSSADARVLLAELERRWAAQELEDRHLRQALARHSERRLGR